MTSALDDCFLHDKDRLAHHEALRLLREGVAPLELGAERLSLQEALGRVLAAPLRAPIDLPGHTNAAVDGYAYAHARARASDGPLPVSQRVRAGSNPTPLASATAARIFTGAPLPEGADTVAMQEDCRVASEGVVLPAIARGANVRLRGEDVRAGTPVLAAGRRLLPADIATAAAFGHTELPVRRPVRVALFSSGDEVRQAGELGYGEVFDANGPMLRAWMAGLPVEVLAGETLPDRREAVEAALAQAALNADLVLTTGGASRGEEDHMLAALDTLGRRQAWQISVKPGRPLMFGLIGTTPYLGLPGNPVAACVCFLLYARPLLLLLAGAGWYDPAGFTVPALFEADSKPDRREFLRGVRRAGGIDKYARDGSGLISSLREADGLIEIPEQTTRIERGDPVTFLPWSSFS